MINSLDLEKEKETMWTWKALNWFLFPSPHLSSDFHCYILDSREGKGAVPLWK